MNIRLRDGRYVSWYRDTNVGFHAIDGSPIRLWAAHEFDDSPAWSIFTGYDSRCSSCYLNQSHTAQLHRVSVTECE